MTTTRRLVLLTVLIGVAVGLAVAVLVPRSTAVDLRGPEAFVPLPGPLRFAPPRPPLPYETTLRVHPGTLRTELTQPDPSGGPDWQVRAFVADRLISKAVRKPGSSGIAGISLCAQLGRVVDGRFGWIDASNTFRHVGIQSTGTPVLCGSRIPDARRMPDVDIRTLITDPLRPDARVRGIVTWGVVGGHVTGLRVRLADRVVQPRRSARGAFLVFAGPALRSDQVRVTVAYPHAPSKTVPSGPSLRVPGMELRDIPRPVPGTARLEARSPDPGGGPSWGLLTARGDHGGWCFDNAQQIIGDRVGRIDSHVGSLYEDGGATMTMSCDNPKFPLTRQRPVLLARGGGSSDEEGRLDPARALVRTLPGRRGIYGIARPDVKLLTIATPRDVRTIVPTPRAHAFVVVYDGDFPSGRITITSTFTDGTTVTQAGNAAL